jgi:hypothetical protein
VGDTSLTLKSISTIIAKDIGNVFYELIRRLAVLYFIFALYAYAKKLCFKSNVEQRIWSVYLFTNLVVLIGFSLFNNFLVSRYTLASVLTLLILAPFCIEHFIQKSQGKRRIALALLIVVLLAMSLDRFNIKNNKRYLKQAGEWAAEHIPQNANLTSNNKLLVYYAKREVMENLDRGYSSKTILDQVASKQIRQYDYLLFEASRSNHYEDEARQSMIYHFGNPVKIFVKDKNTAVFIFAIDQT